MTVTAPPAAPGSAPSAPTRAARPAAAPPRTPNRFGVTTGIIRKGWKLGIYGPEGIGKSSLEASCPGIIIADLENSTQDLDVKRVEGIVPDVRSYSGEKAVIAQQADAWRNLRAWVQQLEEGIYGIDSMTRAEDWCAAYVISSKKSNEGAAASDSIEDFKYKAGLQFVCDEFRRFLSDIETAFLRGVSFVMVAHNRVNRFKSPDGSDFVRHEPRLIDDPKASNMAQWVQFLDHLVFIDQDIAVNKGKASGRGSRTMYFDTSPARLSKTRSLPTEPLVYEKGDTRLWELLGVK